MKYKIPPKLNKGRYNIMLSPHHRKILEMIAQNQQTSFSRVIEFALDLLNQKDA